MIDEKFYISEDEARVLRKSDRVRVVIGDNGKKRYFYDIDLEVDRLKDSWVFE